MKPIIQNRSKIHDDAYNYTTSAYICQRYIFIAQFFYKKENPYKHLAQSHGLCYNEFNLKKMPVFQTHKKGFAK